MSRARKYEPSHSRRVGRAGAKAQSCAQREESRRGDRDRRDAATRRRARRGRQSGRRRARHAPQHPARATDAWYDALDTPFHERAAPSIGGSRQARENRRAEGGGTAEEGVGVAHRQCDGGAAGAGRGATAGAAERGRAAPVHVGRRLARPRVRSARRRWIPPALARRRRRRREGVCAARALVERLGESRLEGLAKKDQRARLRGQLGLKPEKRQKMPYKLLVARRTKERAQDAPPPSSRGRRGWRRAARPARAAAAAATAAGGGGAGSRGGWLAAEKTPSLGGALRGGVLHDEQHDQVGELLDEAARRRREGSVERGGQRPRRRRREGTRPKTVRDYRWTSNPTSLLAAGIQHGTARTDAAAAQELVAPARQVSPRRPASRRALPLPRCTHLFESHAAGCPTPRFRPSRPRRGCGRGCGRGAIRRDGSGAPGTSGASATVSRRRARAPRHPRRLPGRAGRRQPPERQRTVWQHGRRDRSRKMPLLAAHRHNRHRFRCGPSACRRPRRRDGRRVARAERCRRAAMSGDVV